ncbi:sensor histidine kinase [Myceligenerans pegani]|uniref:histidine kinase n=1 Tax=Myceligenerans pegani TaxID=2776917 RepID=A0ABR9N4B2_9MICO|nr:HAMP domain-containing sensor histidine kinase [Myceligenerans sp. TRM 65318]MBE1878111.1 HAMP domain-containing histidine kinase [Myceligenerans sp. TRM 65318]MBE3020382.1 HAMP domain-containing histidine kinase [Myceligenerans sp. TRM 65318]
MGASPGGRGTGGPGTGGRAAGGRGTGRLAAGRRWAGTSLRLRITALATAITLACLLGLATVAGRGLGPLLTDAVDDELAAALTGAAREVVAGRAPVAPDGLEVRVLDTAGAPVDGGEKSRGDARAAPVLSRDQVRALKAGTPITTVPPPTENGGPRPPVRRHGTVVTAPDGSQRLVVAGAGLVGRSAAEAAGGRWLLVVALAGTVVAGVAIWFAVGSALRPVARMRRSVRGLAPGARVEVPDAAAGELRALADDFNALLDRSEATAERLRRFTGDAAHELRSPVASIRVQSEVAVANPDPELSQEVHADVLADAERLSALLDGLLALARSDAGELPPSDDVDLVGEVRAAVARAGEQPVPIAVNAMAGEAWAAAAHTEVELALDNLLRNACRYTRTRVVVSVLSGRSSVRVLVDDDGPGVPPEHRSKIFDRFYRVSDDRARASGGAGLGLALVAELVRRRGGRVAVADSPDGGARFTVVWPRAGGGAGAG